MRDYATIHKRKKQTFHRHQALEACLGSVQWESLRKTADNLEPLKLEGLSLEVHFQQVARAGLDAVI